MSENNDMAVAVKQPEMSNYGVALFAIGVAGMMSPKRVAEIEAQLDRQDECCRKDVHCGLTVVRGGVERHACCDRVVTP